MRDNFRIGTPVEFESDEGLQTGKFTGTIASLVNGQPYGVVELDRALPGIACRVPMTDIKLRNVKAAA